MGKTSTATELEYTYVHQGIKINATRCLKFTCTK